MANANGLKSIVVATDFSHGAQAALERAVLLPLAPKAKLTVLHVLPADIPGRLRKEALSGAEQKIEQLIAGVQGKQPSLNCVGDVLEGQAAHEITKRANTVEADVICIGRHGRRGVVELVVGSTATRVLRHTERPLLVVRTPPLEPYRRVLMAVNPAHRAHMVVKTGLTLLDREAEVTLFTATPIPYEDFVSIDATERVQLRKKLENDAEKALAAVVTKLPEHSYATVVRSGDARSLVVEEAAACKAELTVVGTHGRKPLSRLLVGSVAEWTLAHTKNDVLVVRP